MKTVKNVQAFRACAGYALQAPLIAIIIHSSVHDLPQRCFALQALEHLCDTVGQTASQKEEQLGELLQLSDDFGGRKDTLVRSLQQVEARLSAAKAGSSSLQGIRDLVREIEVSLFVLCLPYVL